MRSPDTRYAKSGDIYIAYQVVGDGQLDLVYVPGGPHHVELNWENQPVARSLRRLAALTRLIAFDKRGTGMSDRVLGVPTLETRMDDIRAVMDAAESRRAVLYAISDAGPLCALFAATYPERTAGLVLIHPTPRFIRAPDFPGCRRGARRSDVSKRSSAICSIPPRESMVSQGLASSVPMRQRTSFSRSPASSD